MGISLIVADAFLLPASLAWDLDAGLLYGFWLG